MGDRRLPDAVSSITVRAGGEVLHDTWRLRRRKVLAATAKPFSVENMLHTILTTGAGFGRAATFSGPEPTTAWRVRASS
jgi:hypothetical protein